MNQFIKSVTPGKVRQRLLIYVAIAAITALIPDLSGDEAITVREGIVIALNTILAGLIAWRAYIDESPTTMKKSE